MALNQDEYFFQTEYVIEGISAVLYKHPVTFKALQFRGEASSLRTIIGETQYRVLVASVGMHIENAKQKEVQLLTSQSALYVPLVVADFAQALTGGDRDSLLNQLDALNAKLHISYGQGL